MSISDCLQTHRDRQTAYKEMDVQTVTDRHTEIDTDKEMDVQTVTDRHTERQMHTKRWMFRQSLIDTQR